MVERSKPQPASFVCYEDLCLRPQTWMRLAEWRTFPAAQAVGEPFRLSERSVDGGFDRELADRAAAIYERLGTHARAALS